MRRRTYTWDEYYEKFFDRAESTQVRNLSVLTSLGPADEVGEVIIELQGNPSAADLAVLPGSNDQALAAAALHHSADRLTEDNIEELYGVAEDRDLLEICKKGI